ncbi:MAG: phosphatidate cytidylyltransferase [Nitrospirota bacterium]
MQKKSGFNVKRHVAAAVILPFFVAYLYLLPPFPYFLAFLIVVGTTAMWEFFVMYKVPVKMYIPGVIAGALMLYMSCIYPEYFLYSFVISMFIMILLRLFSAAAPSGSMRELGPLGTGFLYIAGLMSFQWFLRKTDLGLGYVFLLYISVWFSDSGAYYIGTYMGKNKLCPTISPNKTVEGAFGSILGGALGAVISKFIFGIPLSIAGIAVVGVILGITAMTGDLIESMFKRDAGIKDSSTIIPGHGGILDKIDGMLVSGPVLYLIVRYL